ncbi:N-acetylmuramoyl-L-alanine amidase [Flagellimonas myxillae]|uniref:N-acetylmuramoyl-L-alanine amidase n=1 Tax=Flagellimonas myxillae TaxID=2942214 RepID=UPI00201E7BE8|nr:N-acetylmuramoyl-L-alanine amidase [Muricauda myxillae]MCL6267636.1 N-acetylmuramoyl-L-alanine amidase [Muricauda myxillae]
MRFIPTFLLCVGMQCMLFAQENYYTVVAEKGDGIFSMLRKQGLDPVKHYEEFIILNKDDIKDGSLLHIGRNYKIPISEDSYKTKGVQVSTTDQEEKPLFDAELGKMYHKSEALKDAVYYLIAEDSASAQNHFVADITKNLAAELLEQGATVYVMGNTEEQEQEVEVDQTQMEKLGSYIDAINKRYLQHQGKYQRLLVIRANGILQSGNLDVSVYHHDKSEQGQRLAENLQNVFKKNSAVKKSEINSKTFEDKSTLFLAKNTLPAVSMITVNKHTKKSTENAIPVRSDKRAFANWITDGILKDYAELSLEE